MHQLRVLITGAGGQVGSELTKLLPQADALTRSELDISNAKAVDDLISVARPDVIINAASFTDVDGCEKKIDEAFAANAFGVRNLAVSGERISAHVIHISTDYVFDGTLRRPYNEWDDTNPLSVYGRSKLGGEVELMHNCSRWTIARTAWVYGNRGKDFVAWALSAYDDGKLSGVVDDQFSSPTLSTDLAKMLVSFAEERVLGMFHVANTGVGSRFDQAELALSLTGRDPASVGRLAAADLNRPAIRPDYSALDSMGLTLAGLKPLRNWREALEEYLSKSK